MFYSHVIDDALESKVGKKGLHRAALDPHQPAPGASADSASPSRIAWTG